MGTSRTNSKTSIALLLGLTGLCAAPTAAQAQQHPRLLFLGIGKDGRAYQTAENAVKLRLAGLDVSVMQPKEIPEPQCERAECLAAALSRNHADLALTGRILKNERACLATLWLAADNDKEKLIEHDVACRPDGKDSDLAADLADGAAALLDEHFRDREPPPALDRSSGSVIADVKPAPDVTKQRVWSAKRKAATAGAGILLVASVAATVTFSVLDGRVAQVGSTVPYPLAPYATISGLAAGASVALLLALNIK